MASSYSSRLITPPTEEEEIYPYRRVWLSIILEAGILFAFTLILFFITRVVNIPGNFRQLLNIGLSLMPAVLWLIFTWWRERTVPQPRHNLLIVAVVTALAANAVAIPLIDTIFQVDRWLPLETAINRIIGYTFTVGLVQTLTVYLAARYLVKPAEFRIRLDGVAYARASAIGYATVLNLQFALTTAAEPAVTAMNTFDQMGTLVCTSIIVGYGLAEIRLMMAMAAFASFVTGVAIPLIAGLANTAISPLSPISTVRPLLGFLFSAGLLVIIGLIFWFLFRIEEQQAERPTVEVTESFNL